MCVVGGFLGSRVSVFSVGSFLVLERFFLGGTRCEVYRGFRVIFFY